MFDDPALTELYADWGFSLECRECIRLINRNANDDEESRAEGKAEYQEPSVRRLLRIVD